MDEDLEAWCTQKREQYTLHSVHHGHHHHCVHSVCVCSCRCVHTCVPARLCTYEKVRGQHQVSSLPLLCLIFGDKSCLELIYSARLAVQGASGISRSDSPAPELQTCNSMPSFPGGLWMRTRVLMLFAAAHTRGAVSSALTASYLVLCKHPTGAKA